MESEHASRGHHNSSVYDLFYFIIFFFLMQVDNSSEAVQVNRSSGLETYRQEFDTTNRGGGQTYKPMKENNEVIKTLNFWTCVNKMKMFLSELEFLGIEFHCM